MSLKALTANTAPEENAHILAEDDAAIFQSMFGEDGVLETGQQMKATVISNNKVRVADGVVCIGGHIARTVYGDYTDLTIENGESGKNRNDLIIGTFSTTGAGGIDTMQLAVKKGVAGTAATDPVLTQGNLYAGSKLREVPLWRVKIEGISITKVEQLFENVPSIPTLKKELESLNGNMPIIVPFTVPAFQASTPSHEIKVDLGVTMQNANYKLSIENQSVKVQYSSYKWLDYTIDTKTVSSVTIGFYNEQSRAIGKTDWALIIFPG